MSRLTSFLFSLPLALSLLAGCAHPPGASPLPPPGATPRAGLTTEETATLRSLTLLDDYPLYTLHYEGDYPRPLAATLDSRRAAPRWGCSLFAAFADPHNGLYGRNFDWEYSPALLLFTDPPDGYASVSMVDIQYLGYSGAQAKTLADAPLEERARLLEAPLLPFDGMNEKGVAIGMAAVPSSDMPLDPAKETIGSLGIIRQILDHAASVDEALELLGSYNVDMAGGPSIHYLIADRSGKAALVEFSRGKMVVTSNSQAWHLATNFQVAEAGENPAGVCWRYDRLSLRLADAAGRLTLPEGLALLQEVSQTSTQWSIVYALGSGEIQVVMGRQYETPHGLKLETAGK